jgi:hypothetical protein
MNPLRGFIGSRFQVHPAGRGFKIPGSKFNVAAGTAFKRLWGLLMGWFWLRNNFGTDCTDFTVLPLALIFFVPAFVFNEEVIQAT